jgi:hypothetical protein
VGDEFLLKGYQGGEDAETKPEYYNWRVTRRMLLSSCPGAVEMNGIIQLVVERVNNSQE